jgi:hypothetical protein
MFECRDREIPSAGKYNTGSFKNVSVRFLGPGSLMPLLALNLIQWLLNTLLNACLNLRKVCQISHAAGKFEINSLPANRKFAEPFID